MHQNHDTRVSPRQVTERTSLSWNRSHHKNGSRVHLHEALLGDSRYWQVRKIHHFLINDFSSSISYSLIIDNGCPSDAFTSLLARSNNEDRFSTETLKFPESNYVYIQVVETTLENSTGRIDIVYILVRRDCLWFTEAFCWG